MKHPVIAIIGAGHLGSALIGGLIAAGYDANRIWGTAPTSEQLAELRQRLGIQISTDNRIAAEQADIVILAVKPIHISKVTAELAELQHKPLIISVAAGTPEHQLHSALGNSVSIIRAMPNTPALIGCGATALYANSFVTETQKQQAEDLFSAVGTIVWLENEEHLFTVTALSGSGPAYFFLLMAALEEAGIKLGLPQKIAHELTVQTALGSARMASESRQSPEDLCNQVASPGGGTEQALHVLESQKFRDLMLQAVSAAEQRYRNLAKI